MTALELHDITTWAKAEIERRRDLLEKSDTLAAEHRGAIAAHRQLLAKLEPPKHETIETPSYGGFGETLDAPAY